MNARCDDYRPPVAPDHQDGLHLGHEHALGKALPQRSHQAAVVEQMRAMLLAIEQLVDPRVRKARLGSVGVPCPPPRRMLAQHTAFLAPSQVGLFDDASAIDRRTKLNAALDAINQRLGRGAVAVAGAGTDRGWLMRRGNRTPAYTTDPAKLPLAK